MARPLRQFAGSLKSQQDTSHRLRSGHTRALSPEKGGAHTGGDRCPRDPGRPSHGGAHGRTGHNPARQHGSVMQEPSTGRAATWVSPEQCHSKCGMTLARQNRPNGLILLTCKSRTRT